MLLVGYEYFSNSKWNGKMYSFFIPNIEYCNILILESVDLNEYDCMEILRNLKLY